MSDHDAFLASYDSHRQELENKISKEMAIFLENLKPNVGLKIAEPFSADKSLQDSDGSWFRESNSKF